MKTELKLSEGFLWKELVLRPTIDPETQLSLFRLIERELAKRSVSGAMVYFIVLLAVAYTTPYYRQHPVLIGFAGGLTLVLGATRMLTARSLAAEPARGGTAVKRVFYASTYGIFLAWGLFCAWSLHLYASEWTAMIILLSTASLAGGTSSALSPNFTIAWRCLTLLIAPTCVAAATLGDPRHWALGGLGGVYLVFLISQAKDNWRAFWAASVAAEQERVRGSAERIQAERERTSLVAAIEQAAEEILITDTEGTIQYCNPAFSQVTGYSRAEAVGRNPRLLKSGTHDKYFYTDLWSTIKNGRVWTGRFTNRKKDGTTYEAEGTISPIHDAEGKLAGFVSARHDVTELLRLEAQLRQAQKMESIGRLAGGVAHDFNNLLTVIIGYGELLQKLCPAEDARRPYVEGIRQAAENAANLTQQLLAFSRKQIVQPKSIDVNHFIRRIEELLRRLIGENVELRTVLDPGAGLVVMDEDQMTQVFMNLAANARDAMRKGGTLTVRTKQVSTDDLPAGAEISGPVVMLSFSDTGAGMDEDTRQHIFEPFFTTKEKGRGTGLGLSTVYGIVQQSGGCIEVLSEPGQGSTFAIYLASAAAVPIETTSDSQPLEPVAASETILVVEDQQEIRGLIEYALRSSGFRVLSAPNGREALATASQHDGEIDLLLTDVIMPGMTGRQVADELRLVRPRVKVLFISGYSGAEIAEHGVLEGGVAYLPKPFTPHVLMQKVRRTLGGTV
jgi:PAS domain S-box-containing protein